MKQNVRHPRLHMYYESAAMNMATVGVSLSLIVMWYSAFSVLSIVAMCMFFAFMLAYTLWFWIGKPKNVRTSTFLSDISTVYFVYAMIVSLICPTTIWWGVFGVVSAIAILLIYTVKG